MISLGKRGTWNSNQGDGSSIAFLALLATREGIFVAFPRFTAGGWGALFLSETVSKMFLLGLACVLAGLWIAHRPPPRVVEPHAAATR